MFIQVKKAKIYRATVTESDINYQGGIGIDENLMEASGILEGERVQVLDVNNGEGIETYVIKAKRGSGTICINGAAERRVIKGDMVIIIAYAYITPEEHSTFTSVDVFPDKNNKI